MFFQLLQIDTYSMFFVCLFQFGKRYNVSTAPEDKDAGQRAVLWGGYEDVIILCDSDEDKGHEEEVEQGAAGGKKTLLCPKHPDCPAAYKGGIVKRLRRHVESQHADDPQFEEYNRKLDQLYPPRTKTAKVECPLCGKYIAGRGTQLGKHQQSSSCVRL